MNKADTPVLDKEKEKETTTPSGTDTPVEEPKGEPTSPTPQEQKVVELEAEVDRLANLLNKQEAIAKTSQRERAIAERKKRELQETLKGIRTGEIDISETNLPAEFTPSEEENVKKDIQIGVQNLLLGNSDYQNLLSEDITLREVLKKNPLVLIGEHFSVEDAVEQIKDRLDERVSSLKKVQPKEEKKEGKSPEFDPGAVQPPEAPETPPKEKTFKTPDEEIEESIKSKIKFT